MWRRWWRVVPCAGPSGVVGSGAVGLADGECFVVDGAGVTTWYDPAHNAYLEAYSGEPFIFEISAHDPQGDVLTYEWFMSIDGSLSSQTSDESVFRCSMPAYASLVDVFCDVSDSNGNNIAVRPTRIAVF